MKYLNRFTEVVKNWKVYVAIAISMFLSLVQTSFQVIGIQNNIYRKVKMIGSFIDLIIISFMILPYVLTMGVMKTHMRHAVNRRLLMKVDSKITIIASRIMTSIMVLYSPYVIFDVMLFSLARESPLRKDEWFHFGVFIGYQLAIINSFVNAVICMCSNRKLRRKFVTFPLNNERNDILSGRVVVNNTVVCTDVPAENRNV